MTYSSRSIRRSIAIDFPACLWSPRSPSVSDSPAFPCVFSTGSPSSAATTSIPLLSSSPNHHRAALSIVKWTPPMAVTGHSAVYCWRRTGFRWDASQPLGSNQRPFSISRQLRLAMHIFYQPPMKRVVNYRSDHWSPVPATSIGSNLAVQQPRLRPLQALADPEFQRQTFANDARKKMGKLFDAVGLREMVSRRVDQLDRCPPMEHMIRIDPAVQETNHVLAEREEKARNYLSWK